MMAARARWRGKTTARGLGGPHQTERQIALTELEDGDPCARCQQRGIYHPMYRWAISTGPSGKLVAPLLDLDDFPGRSYGGPQVKRLSWRSCNRSEGATRGNRMRGGSIPAAMSNRYTTRRCEICGSYYRPNHAQQRTCGRECGVVLKRQNRLATGWQPQREKTAKRQADRAAASAARVRHIATMRAAGARWVDVADAVGLSGPGAAYYAANPTGRRSRW